MNEQDVSKIMLQTYDLLQSLREEDERNTLLFEILVEELQELDVENQRKLESQPDILQIYRSMENSLTQEEKDEFFLCYLKRIQGVADEGRSKLRSIVKKYIAATRQ